MQKYFIQLDICTLCDLNCVSCGMRHLNYGSLGPGYLKFDNFKKFIDDNKEMISKIEISNSGEPFINPDSPKILKYAFENGITLTCRNGTNFNNVSEETIKAIVDYQLEDIFIAIDGASQEVYEKYRRNGNYNKVIENVKKLVEYKKLKNSSLPNIYWQYIIRESTDDPLEIESAIKQANEIGDIKIKFKLTWENDYIPKNEEEVKKLTGLTSLTRSEYNTNGNDESYLQENKCYLLWSRIAINWDGRLLGCCQNKIPFNINVFDIGLANALKSDQLIAAKRFILGEIDNDFSNPCMKCFKGQKINRDKTFKDFLKKYKHKEYGKDFFL